VRMTRKDLGDGIESVVGEVKVFLA